VRLSPEVRPSSHSKYLRKIPSGFWQEQGKGNHLEICQSTPFFLTKPILRGNWLTRALPAGILSESVWPGEGK